MEASMLTFTKEFKERAEKGLSRRRIGELRWEKLLELDKKGVIQEVHNRKQLGALVGITKPKSYHQWITALIKKGRLSETLRGFENSKAVFEYHIENAEEPKAMPKATTPNVVLSDTPTTSLEVKPLAGILMTITTASTIIKLENLDASSAVEIIKAVNK